MTLKEVIRTIEIIASQQPSINMVCQNDVFRLNDKADAKYGVFAWLQKEHSSDLTSGILTFRFTFFYVDRLTSDKGNQIEIQSVGIQTLTNILRQLDERGIFVDTYTLQPFNQRFVDECAGVFTNVTLEVRADDLCSESFADYNEDFNEDFMIF